MTLSPLPPEQQTEALRRYEVLRQATDHDLRQLAELLASKPDGQLLGATELEVRDRIHRLGAQALETALAERKKGGIKVPVPLAPTVATPPSSSVGSSRRW